MAAPEQTKAPKPPRNQLSHAHFYRLCEWLKTADLAGNFTYTAVAALATATMEIIVPPSSVQNAIATVGVSLPDAPEPAEPKDRVRVVARELAALLRDLGKEPSPELLAVLGGKRA